MGKLRQLLRYIRDNWWKPSEGDIKWHIVTELKRYFWGSTGVGTVLAFTSGIITSGYLAFRAWIDSQPVYFVASIFLTAFALFVIIINGIREWWLWSRWKKGQLPFQQESSHSVLAPHEILHPASSSMLWRWDTELGTLGPFCPIHPQERLSLKSRNGMWRKSEDFEKDHLSYNWFICPVDDEEFKPLEEYAHHVYRLRAQVTSRFRERFRSQDSTTPGKNSNEEIGILEVQYLHSEIKWKGALGGSLNPLIGEVPHNATLYLQVTAKITATPPRIIESIILDLAGDSIEAHDWAPERIDQREACLQFRATPSIVGYGKLPAHLIIRAFGPNSGVIEKHFQGFTVIIATSSSDLQKFSDTSREKTSDPKTQLSHSRRRK